MATASGVKGMFILVTAGPLEWLVMSHNVFRSAQTFMVITYISIKYMFIYISTGKGWEGHKTATMVGVEKVQAELAGFWIQLFPLGTSRSMLCVFRPNKEIFSQLGNYPFGVTIDPPCGREPSHLTSSLSA